MTTEVTCELCGKIINIYHKLHIEVERSNSAGAVCPTHLPEKWEALCSDCTEAIFRAYRETVEGRMNLNKHKGATE